jgi:hypothetical protein
MEMYGDTDYLEALLGLKIQLDFGPKIGKCIGTAEAIHDIESKGKNMELKVLWRCDDDNDTTYESVLHKTDFLHWYFHDHSHPPNERPDWIDEKDLDLQSCPLLTNPAGIQKLANWEFPDSAEESGMFPWAKGTHDDDRWWTTIACLNDPKNKRRYDPSGKRSYPTALLLTMILITKECYDPETKLPLIVTEDMEAVLKYADQYSGLIRQSGRGHGYQEMQNLASIAQDILKDTKKGWSKKAFQKTQGLILTLSDEYESSALNDNYRYCNDLELMGETFASICRVFQKVLLDDNHPISDQDRDFLKPHLEAGPYEEMIENDEDAEEMWNALSEAWELG